MGLKIKIDSVKRNFIIDGWVGTDIVTKNLVKLSKTLSDTYDVTVSSDGALFWGLKVEYYYKWDKSDLKNAIILEISLPVYQPERKKVLVFKGYYLTFV